MMKNYCKKLSEYRFQDKESFRKYFIECDFKEDYSEFWMFIKDCVLGNAKIIARDYDFFIIDEELGVRI